MKLLIIQPTTSFQDGTPYRTKRRWIMGLTLPYLAGLTPPWVQVRLQDDRYMDIDYGGGYDLVALTTTIATAARAYDIAAEFRKRGTPVVMGGFHASLLPEECLEHCDAVVEGEAEYSWPELLEDFRAGKMKRRYKAAELHDLKGLPAPRWDLLDRRKYLAPFLPVMTTRGCPFRCSFCEVPVVYGTRYRHRPVDEVIGDMRRIPTRKIQIVDDNIAASRDYAKELFSAMIPLGVRWSCLWTINTSRDTELLDLAVKAGVSHVNIGIESVSQSSLSSINKRQNKVGEYVQMLKELERRGIFYSLNFMFGLDEDMPGIFAETMDFLKRVNAPMAFFNTVTPREGTVMRSQLIEEGRIVNPLGDRYLGMQCLFTPKNMTPQAVEEGVWRCFREFYSLPKIVKRFLFPPNSYIGQGLPSNLIFAWAVRRRRDPVDFY
ncbi:B12-binding domain-containing radical SAM protein [Geobacter sp. SVR]|uniref:B12-binding domain-containing radical SAM protein n=1 Tax=Geobacter sp. SVR TaxID=2495594 RepID=UPI00143EF780|nr:radical SAM protein [Geobacter sp. SVR]BCS55597.1 B12-binding domain-containing radical SAM protein [Geobacter sp. SVR]GCF83600.1 B12-binding domain-containing radical SAM protein [Geobacter sp. SVR]